MHLLQIISKNTSTLDYSLPVLWKIRRQYPQAKLSVLFGVANKKQTLRDSTFLPNFFNENDINVLDFGDFLKIKSKWVRSVFRYLFSDSQSDLSHFSHIHEFESFGLKIKFCVEYFVKKILQLFERKIVGPFFIDLDSVLPHLSPDIIFFDQKTFLGFYGKGCFYKFIVESKIPIVLMPHAPHFINPTDEYFPYYKDHPEIAVHADFWNPFQYGEPWKNLPERKSQFPFIGYPGLDSEWLDYILKNKKEERSVKNQGSLKCLLVIRKFLPKDFRRPENFDPFTLDYEDLKRFLQMVGEAIRKTGLPVENIVKPHPSNNFQMTRELLEQVELPAWSFSYDPFYALLPKIDFGIALFSTANLIPILAGIPMILMNTPLQKFVGGRWSVLDGMYSGLEFLSNDIIELESMLQKIGDRLLGGGSEDFQKDILHLRKYFPDRAMDRALDRINGLLGSSAEDRKMAI